jgi:hypothetical protein
MANRRNFIKATGLGIAAATVPGLATASVSQSESSKSEFGFQLGVASYSLPGIYAGTGNRHDFALRRKSNYF